MDRRSFTIRGIDDYKWALQLIGCVSDDSDENANDSSEVNSVVDATNVGDRPEAEYIFMSKVRVQVHW